jgi:hypothetical protein
MVDSFETAAYVSVIATIEVEELTVSEVIRE